MSDTKVAKNKKGSEKKNDKNHTLYRDPRQNRRKSTADYQPPTSDREWAWRRFMTEAPKPGTYEVQSFIDELNKRYFTYLLKCEGRKRQLNFCDGRWLLPGAYDFPGDVERLQKTKNTYSFRATGREARILFNCQDKDHLLGPGQYASEKYDCIDVPKVAVTHYSMKSLANRFKYLTKKQGADVVSYESKSSLNTSPSYASCFNSKTPRFVQHFSKVPGPGTYTHTFEPIYSWNSCFSDYYV